MSNKINNIYVFANFRLLAHERILLHAGQHLPLQPKVFETLCALVEQHGHVVSKDELMERVWPDTVVEEINLAKNISHLRKVLAAAAGTESTEAALPDKEFIETISKRGYRFVAPVQLVTQAEAPVPAPSEAAATRNETSAPIRNENGEPRSQPERKPVNSNSLRTRRFALKRRWLVSVAFALAITVGLFGTMSNRGASQQTGGRGWLWQFNPVGSLATAFETMTIKLLAGSGQTLTAAISPNGEWIAYTQLNVKLQNSVWLRQVNESQEGHEITPPVRDEIRGLTFAPDGRALYYMLQESRFKRSLWRVTVNGGTPEHVLELGHSSPASLDPTDPTGQRLAFVREDGLTGQWSLIVMTLADKREQIITTRRTPNYLSIDEAPGWSPDGQSLLCAEGDIRNGVRFHLQAIAIADGSARQMTAEPWHWMRQAVWLTQGQGIVVSGRLNNAQPQNQLWLLPAPGQPPRRITNDLNYYDSNFSVAADNRVLIAMRKEMRAHLWVAPGKAATTARQLTSSGQNVDGLQGMDWTPDGRIVFTSWQNDQLQLWISNADGTNKYQLTKQEDVNNHSPSVSADGQYVVFISNQKGTGQLWRMRLDGSALTQLTFGVLDATPRCSPTSDKVVYTAMENGKRTLWQVPLAGGPAQKLADRNFEYPSFAPDGQTIIGLSRDETNQNQEYLIRLAAQSGQVQQLHDPRNIQQTGLATFTLLNHFNLDVAPDGKAVAGIFSNKDNVANIYGLTFDRNEVIQYTHFKEGMIGKYAWSRDGHQLALARGDVAYSSAVIRDFLNAHIAPLP